MAGITMPACGGPHGGRSAAAVASAKCTSDWPAKHPTLAIMAAPRASEMQAEALRLVFSAVEPDGTGQAAPELVLSVQERVGTRQAAEAATQPHSCL